MKDKKKYSTNELAGKIVGKRNLSPNTVIFDFPCELGYHCPKCEYKNIVNGNYDERLEWSEYNGFIWCSICNKDYPSAICHPDPERATEIYLTTVQDVILLKQENA